MAMVAPGKLCRAGATVLWLMPYVVYQWDAGQMGFAVCGLLVMLLAGAATWLACHLLPKFDNMLVYLALWFVLFNLHLLLVVVGHKLDVSDALVQQYGWWLPLYQWMPMVYLLVMLFLYWRLPKLGAVQSAE